MLGGRFRVIGSGELVSAISSALSTSADHDPVVNDEPAIVVAVGAPIDIDRDASTITIEAMGAHVIVSPLLGDAGFCPSCWRLRRLAAWATTSAPTTENPWQILADFRVAAMPSPSSWTRRQLTAVCQTIIGQSRSATPRRPFATSVIVTPMGEERTEWVIARPDCHTCQRLLHEASRLPATERPGEAALVGPAAGIVTRLEAIPPLPEEPAYPFVVAASLANTWLTTTQTSLSAASGKGPSLDTAMATALGEAVERYAALSAPSTLIMARPRELAMPHISAHDLHGLTPDQTASLGLANDDDVQAWVPARPVTGGDEVALPASAVFTRSPRGCRPATPFSTSGAACDWSLDTATQSAWAELLERDAFFSTWYGGGSAMRIPVDVEAPEWFAARRGFTAAQIAVNVYDLGSAGGVRIAACVLLGQRHATTRPGRVIGLGHGLTPATAAISAIREAGQVYRGLTYALRDCSLQARQHLIAANPGLIRTPLDHALAFAANSDKFDMTGGRMSETSSDAAKPPQQAFAVDITPLDIAAVTRLRVVRVVGPGLVPYHVGRDQIPWRILQRRIPGSLIDIIESQPQPHPHPHPLC
jgi:ribosomal protein S12 methylthiotransferase accessory factor